MTRLQQAEAGSPSDWQPIEGEVSEINGKESAYAFAGPDKLVSAFQSDLARWNRENRDS